MSLLPYANSPSPVSVRTDMAAGFHNAEALLPDAPATVEGLLKRGPSMARFTVLRAMLPSLPATLAAKEESSEAEWLNDDAARLNALPALLPQITELVIRVDKGCEQIAE